MRSTRRLLDRRSAALVAACSLVTAAATSCSSSDDTDPSAPLESPDAAPDASPPAEGGAVEASRDAGAFDAAPLPVVCESQPCAVSLVTTLSIWHRPVEGFCALLDDGSVACWGANDDGQLGRGDDGGLAASASPARVVGVSDVAKLDHTCALDKSGGVWCWGPGPHLRSDAGAVTVERTPVRLPLPAAKDVGMGEMVGCAAVDHGVLCWGQNQNGQVKSPPAPGELSTERITIPPGAPIRDVVVGGATFALREDGVALSWGANPPLARVSSLDPDPHPAAIALGPISSIDVTSESGCATSGGVGYCWGAIAVFPPTTDSPSKLLRALPEPVVAPEPVVQIATTRNTRIEEIARPQRWCAVAASGAVYCWGINESGQAGDGTKQYAYHAVEVQGLPGPAAEVKTMPMSTCALLTSGKIYCWGNNFYGQLGHGRIKGVSPVPQEVVLP